MKRMTDEEKIALIRLLREMKPVSNELKTAFNDAYMKAISDSESNAMELANKAVADIADGKVDITTNIFTASAYERLALSNDWNFGQIDEFCYSAFRYYPVQTSDTSNVHYRTPV